MSPRFSGLIALSLPKGSLGITIASEYHKVPEVLGFPDIARFIIENYFSRSQYAGCINDLAPIANLALDGPFLAVRDTGIGHC